MKAAERAVTQNLILKTNPTPLVLGFVAGVVAESAGFVRMLFAL